ncbi:MAG TPA: response regulator transcription factor [Chroococcales cyanobacterium]
MAKILMVEDDRALRETVDKWLTFEHHRVEIVDNGESALESLKFYKYDLIILDLNLPKVSGLEVCKQFRQSGGVTPILMLTGKDKIEEKEEGFDLGADDYLTKPFHLKELSVRVRALLRRPQGYTGNVLEAGTLVLEPSTFRVVRDGEEVQLSQQEFALLEFLMRNQNQVFSPEALLDRVWESSSDVSPAAIRTHVKMLRKKLDREGQPSYIRNIHGVGYRFEAH